MNKYVLGVAVAVFGAIVIAPSVGLRYSQATLLFGLIAALSAPVVLHKISDRKWSVAMLLGLSYFASFPLKKLFKIDGFVSELPVTIAYAAILWTIGLGWRRTWR